MKYLSKVLNVLGHKIKPHLFSNYKLKQRKRFKKNEIPTKKCKNKLIAEHHDLCLNFDYKDESWNGIKHIGEVMWNDSFYFLPIFKRSNSFDLNFVNNNSKVVYIEDKIICKSKGKKNDWIFLKNNITVNFPYVLEFDAKIQYENSEFQFAFFYENIGNRYRFNLKDNKVLAFEIVGGGGFHNDIFKKNFSLPLNTWSHFKIVIDKNEFSYFVDDQCILSVKQIKKQPNFNSTFALILWDTHNSNIDTEYKNLKLFKIQ